MGALPAGARVVVVATALADLRFLAASLRLRLMLGFSKYSP